MARVPPVEREPDASPAGLADRLRELLFGHGKRIYVFVDPLLHDPIDRDALAGTDARVHSVDLPNWGIAPRQYPYFIALDSSLDPLLDGSGRIAFEQARDGADVRSLCGWFASDLPAARLRRLFAAQMRRSAGGEPWLFRFFDPRVMQHLPGVFGAPGAVAGVERWWYLDHRGAVRAVRGAGEDAEPVAFSAEQQSKIDRIGALNQAFAQWREADEPPADAFARLDQALAQAQALGFSLEDEADCVAFALHRCLVHPQIETHPAVAGWIAAMRSKQASYVDQAAQSDARLWADIESGHWMAGRQGARHG